MFARLVRRIVLEGGAEHGGVVRFGLSVGTTALDVAINHGYAILHVLDKDPQLNRTQALTFRATASKMDPADE